MNESVLGTKQDITVLLSFYEAFIQHQNRMQKFDINKDCEDIFCNVLNTLYDYNLMNLNRITYNHPAIDLGDDKRRVCYQVTSTDSISKASVTLDLFNSHSLNKNYTTINILILQSIKSKKMKKYEENFRGSARIIDMHLLNEEIQYCDSIEKLKKVKSYLMDFVLNFLNSASFELIEKKETVAIHPKNCDAYINFVGDKDCVSDITSFITNLCALRMNERKLIAIAIKKQIPQKCSYNSRIHFNHREVTKWTNNSDEATEILRHLNQIGYIEEKDEMYDMAFFYFPGTYHDDVLYTIVDFCESKNINVEDIIVGLNFSLLD